MSTTQTRNEAERREDGDLATGSSASKPPRWDRVVSVRARHVAFLPAQEREQDDARHHRQVQIRVRVSDKRRAGRAVAPPSLAWAAKTLLDLAQRNAERDSPLPPEALHRCLQVLGRPHHAEGARRDP